jgi:hypothetical protein
MLRCHDGHQQTERGTRRQEHGQELRGQVPVEQCDEWSTGLRRVMRRQILMSPEPDSMLGAFWWRGTFVEFKVAASSQRRASRVKGRQMGGPVATCRSASMTLNRRSRCASDRQADARDANTPDRTRLERGWVMVEERVGDVEGAS